MSIRNTSEKSVFTISARTASENSSTISVDEYLEGDLHIDITAASGTNETLQFAVQAQITDSSSAWKYIAIGKRHYATDTEIIPLTNFGKQIRVQAIIGGTSPSFTFTSDFVGKT